MYNLTCSIVLYNTNEDILNKAIDSVLENNIAVKLYLVDNSEKDNLKKFAVSDSVEYIFNKKNLGFGKAHNLAIKRSLPETKYHLVLNPDVRFEKNVLEDIYHFMEAHKDVGQLMPKVFYENGSLQKLCHLLPEPVNLISRRFLKETRWAKKLNDKYELKDFNYDTCINVPNLSGCFMFLRREALQTTGIFDERYFMYMEDIDLTRRIHAHHKTIFYPYVNITHGFEKESYTNPAVLKHHISSAIKYFNKWGWLFDKERDLFNQKILNTLFSLPQN